MATESPLIVDGSQTTANTDMSGPAPFGTGATLAGQGGSGQFLAVNIVGSRLVDIVATGEVAVYGIVQNKPRAGQAAAVGIMGVTKACAGAAVSSGAALQVMDDGSGRLITHASTAVQVAVALEAAAGSTSIFTVALIPNASALT